YKFGENGLPPTGIPYVIVNGTIVVEESKVLAVKPGLPIRFPVEDKGRYQPIELNNWLGAHTISVPDMHMLDDTGGATEFKR
ncbi:MAG: aminoacylase, partial [Proteobacteria bacterium]|nr:aminoacylase [Pseudomonadota bacterium]